MHHSFNPAAMPGVAADGGYTRIGHGHGHKHGGARHAAQAGDFGQMVEAEQADAPNRTHHHHHGRFKTSHVEQNGATQPSRHHHGRFGVNPSASAQQAISQSDLFDMPFGQVIKMFAQGILSLEDFQTPDDGGETPDTSETGQTGESPDTTGAMPGDDSADMSDTPSGDDGTMPAGPPDTTTTNTTATNTTATNTTATNTTAQGDGTPAADIPDGPASPDTTAVAGGDTSLVAPDGGDTSIKPAQPAIIANTDLITELMKQLDDEEVT